MGVTSPSNRHPPPRWVKAIASGTGPNAQELPQPVPLFIAVHMARFKTWWESKENPALSLPESTQLQIKPYMRAAFNGGVHATMRGNILEVLTHENREGLNVSDA